MGEGIRRLLLALSVLILLTSASLTTSQATAAKPPTKAQFFQTYVRKMEPVALPLLGSEALIDIAEAQLQIYGVTEDPEDLAGAISALRDARDSAVKARVIVRKIKPPAGFTEPHNGVASAALMVATAARVFADALESGRDQALPRIRFEAAHDLARDGYAQWRAETISQLRRYGLVVPRWVKEFGK